MTGKKMNNEAKGKNKTSKKWWIVVLGVLLFIGFLCDDEDETTVVEGDAQASETAVELDGRRLSFGGYSVGDEPPGDVIVDSGSLGDSEHGTCHMRLPKKIRNFSIVEFYVWHGRIASITLYADFSGEDSSAMAHAEAEALAKILSKKYDVEFGTGGLFTGRAYLRKDMGSQVYFEMGFGLYGHDLMLSLHASDYLQMLEGRDRMERARSKTLSEDEGSSDL